MPHLESSQFLSVAQVPLLFFLLERGLEWQSSFGLFLNKFYHLVLETGWGRERNLETAHKYVVASGVPPAERHKAVHFSRKVGEAPYVWASAGNCQPVLWNTHKKKLKTTNWKWSHWIIQSPLIIIKSAPTVDFCCKCKCLSQSSL